MHFSSNLGCNSKPQESKPPAGGSPLRLLLDTFMESISKSWVTSFSNYRIHNIFRKLVLCPLILTLGSLILNCFEIFSRYTYGINLKLLHPFVLKFTNFSVYVRVTTLRLRSKNQLSSAVECF